MMALSIQLGARVRRKDDIGMDVAGVVVRLKGEEVMTYWPQDNYYEVVPVAELEPYGSLQELVSA